MDTDRLKELAGLQLDEATEEEYKKAILAFKYAVRNAIKIGVATGKLNEMKVREDLTNILFRE